MPMTPGQMAAAAAAIGAAGYLYINHQKNKNVLDKASDKWEQTRLGAQQRAGDDSLSTAAAKSYYDAKEKARA